MSDVAVTVFGGHGNVKFAQTLRQIGLAETVVFEHGNLGLSVNLMSLEPKFGSTVTRSFLRLHIALVLLEPYVRHGNLEFAQTPHELDVAGTVICGHSDLEFAPLPIMFVVAGTVFAGTVTWSCLILPLKVMPLEP